MNAQQRRRLKRIRQRQKDSAGRRLNRGDRQFVIAHTPPPKRVCVVSDAESHKFQDVRIGYRCTSTSHRHYSRKQVEALYVHGVVRWVGDHYRVAAFICEQHWEIRNAALQLLPGTSSKRGARQDVQHMPQLSRYQAGNVAMRNDGRVE